MKPCVRFVVFMLFLGCFGCRNETEKGLGMEDLHAAKRLEAPLAGYVDAVNGIAPQADRTVVLSRGTQTIAVQGWAVDTATAKPGSAMALLVNNHLIRCTYGVARADVATALRNQDYTYSGYTCQIAAGAFDASGITFEPILMAGKGSYYSGPKVVVMLGP
jgi:hypothetical protein